MRILILHQYYLQPGQPGGSRFNEMARFWADSGHSVSIIAGNVNYVTGKKPPEGQKKWIVAEEDGPVRVWRCDVPESYGRSYGGRMWAFTTFAVAACAAMLRAERPDVIVATSPPLTIALPGILAGRLRWGYTPWIFEVRDLWPESAVTSGVLAPGSLLTRALFAIERLAYRVADRINVLTPAFREDILHRGLASPEKIAFIPNGADLDRFQPGPLDNDLRRRLNWGDRFVVLYAGAHGRANAVGQLVEAAECLRDRRDILIACLGDGPDRSALESAARDRGLANIVFLGPQAKDVMPDLVNAANAGAAVLQSNPTFRTVYPNKVFDYMACARPILLAIDGVARRLVCDEAQAGIFAEPENGPAIANAIRHLADHPSECREMGDRGYQWVVAHASRRELARRYLDLMVEVRKKRPQADGAGEIACPTPWHVRRLFDIAGALIAIVALAPLWLAAAVLIRARLGSPVFFRQTRIGLHDVPFRIWKFRTMTDQTDTAGTLLPDALRLTRLGRLLRAASLDELPQLLNVLHGEMSLVGPRPLLPEYLPRYSALQRRRHEVKPGITGLAQINGRNALTWERRFELDVWYVDHRSLRLDLLILARTVWGVARRTGISRDGHATMPAFLGQADEAPSI
jgi:lipopolysaccharide/colanic/teichoic acid biosynthesis glycosyltransferase/glycosyltransferase involved in cell wall biosynthesis